MSSSFTWICLCKTCIQLIERQEKISYGINDYRIDSFEITKDSQKYSSKNIAHPNDWIDKSSLGRISQSTFDNVSIQMYP